MSKRQRKLLNIWYTNNKSKKITFEDLIFLSKKIDSSIPRINQWMKNKRTYQSKKRIRHPKYFTAEQNQILKNFYFNKTYWPSKKNIKDLALETNLPERKIRRWFYKKRFDDKLLNKNE